MDIVEQAKDYLAHNAAESGADEIIKALIAEVESLRKSWIDDVSRILTTAKETNQIVKDANARLDRAGIP